MTYGFHNARSFKGRAIVRPSEVGPDFEIGRNEPKILSVSLNGQVLHATDDVSLDLAPEMILKV